MTEKLKTVQEVLNSLILHTKAEKKQFNKFGNYKYRSGEDILEAIKEELKKDKYPANCTLISNPSLEVIGTRLFVKVTTTLEVGEEKREAVGYAEHGQNKKGMDEAQLTGSTSTYAKKYSLQNLFQLDETSEDIDSKDNTKAGEKIIAPKNALGITQNLVDGVDEDMKGVFNDKNQADYEKIKKAIVGCGSVEELEAEKLKFKKEANSLKKYRPELYAEIADISLKEEARILGVDIAELAALKKKKKEQMGE